MNHDHPNSTIIPHTPPHLNHIPAVLKTISQWVLWRRAAPTKERPKGTKLPYQTNGRLASVKDPSTWGDWECVETAYNQSLLTNNPFSGVGLVLTADCGVVGIDIDHCLDGTTGELSDQARRIVEELDTYCEVSPSGQGLRLFVLGKKPAGGCRQGPVEIYGHGRYLTVTGHVFGEVKPVAERTVELAKVHEREMGGHEQHPTVTDHVFGEVELAKAHDRENQGHEKDAQVRRGGEVLSALLKSAKVRGLFAGDISAYPSHSEADLALVRAITRHTTSLVQIDAIFRRSELYRPKWDELHGSQTYGELTIQKVLASPKEQSKQKKKAEPKPIVTQEGGDMQAAELFLEMFGDSFRHCPGWGKDIIWTGTHWTVDDNLQCSRWADDAAREAFRRAQEESEEGEQKNLLKLGHRLTYLDGQHRMIRKAGGLAIAQPDDFNTNPFLLNVENGTIDLQTGELRPHRRDDLLMHRVKVKWDEQAKAPLWDKFLLDIFGQDAELVRYVQRAVGYSLTGNTQEHVCFVLYGYGSNGKSVFLNTIKKLLGSLADSLDYTLLYQGMNNAHPAGIADCFGRRFVTATELSEGHRFNETLLKVLVSQDAIKARRLYENYWSFTPTHKLWIATNYRPEVKGADNGIWRRLRQIPFLQTFSDTSNPPLDRRLEEKLQAELQGILNWAVQGCLEWGRTGLGRCVGVDEATKDYRDSMDIYGLWISECVVEYPPETKTSVGSNELFKSWEMWCMRNNEAVGTRTAMGLYLNRRYPDTRLRSHGRTTYAGLGLMEKPLG